jgi:hypothetical protein
LIGRHVLVFVSNNTEIGHNKEDFTLLQHAQKNTKKCLTNQKLSPSKVAGVQVGGGKTSLHSNRHNFFIFDRIETCLVFLES